jgi:hypothetical protein
VRRMQGFGEETRRKETTGRPRFRWGDNIKMDPQKAECGGCRLDRAGSGYGQVAGTCDCGNEPSGFKMWEIS